MAMCNKCGFVSYPERYASEKEAKDYYKKEYRNCPSISNLYSGQRKIQYHVAFLKDLFDRWKAENKNPVVTDIGAAFGMFLKMFRDFFHNSEIYGTEWGENFRKHAWYEYGIFLDEDFDETKKYDFISNYKVLEHQCDADLQLKKYAACLNEGGYIYLSVPTWFHTMHNGSLGSWDNDGKEGIEYYYHPDHINVWSRKHVLHMIKKAGLVIEKENLIYYDDTYLLRKPKSGEVVLVSTDVAPDSPEEILATMEKIKKASDLYIEGRFGEAIEVFPNFIKAWTMHYEMNRKQAHQLGYEEIEAKFIIPAIKSCPNVAEAYLFATDIAMRYEKYNKAIEFADKTLQMRPNAPLYLRNLSHCFRQLAFRETNQEQRHKLFQEARAIMKFLGQVSIEHFSESYSWICQDNAQLPLPESRPPNNVITLPQGKVS